MSVMEEQRARTRRSFTDECKRDAVAMVLDDGNKIVDVAGRRGHAGELGAPSSHRSGRARRDDHHRTGWAGRAAPGERPVEAPRVL